MKKITVEEHKEILMNILSHIDHVCRSNKIEYSVSGGTLLGAVRHQGFIPWDDDIDVMLTRSNYEKLLNILKDDEDAQYQLIAENEPGYYYCFSKLCDTRTSLKIEAAQDRCISWLGVYVDIFPIDEMPQFGSELEEHVAQLRKWQNQMFLSIPGYYNYSTSLLVKLVKSVVRLPRYLKARLQHSSRGWQTKLIDGLQKYQKAQNGTRGFILSEYGARDAVPTKVFDSYDDIEFEHILVRTISDYGAYLKALYGDYMELPPIDQRSPKHAYVPYWR